jgi:ubiquinone/menaquinone biosynthesis C-methylase UbiE
MGSAMTAQDETARARRARGLRRLTVAACFDTYERIAPLYDAMESFWEISWKKRLRRMLFDKLHGRVLDAGVGTGLNIPYCPADVDLVGVDLSPKMLTYAAARARKHGKDVTLASMDLRNLEFPDAHFDGIVSAFVFCTLSDQDRLAALRELARICRPDGTIRILDYSLSRRPVMRFVMRCCEPWFRWMFNATYQVRFEEFAGLAGLELVGSTLVVGDYVKISEFRPRAKKPAGMDEARDAIPVAGAAAAT